MSRRHACDKSAMRATRRASRRAFRSRAGHGTCGASCQARPSLRRAPPPPRSAGDACGTSAPMRRSISQSDGPHRRPSSARTAPARPICSRRCRCSRPAAGCAGPTLGDCARVGGAGGFAVSIEVEEDGASRQLGVGLEPARREAPASGSTASTARRSPRRAPSPTSAHRLADAGDGWAVHRPGERASAFPRPARARDRSQSRRAGQSVRARAAGPQPSARRGRAQRRLARRDRARGGRTRRRGRRGARRMRRRGSRRSIARRARRFLAVSRGPNLRSKATSSARRTRFRRSTPRSATARCCATIAAATPPPGAR